MQKSKTYWPGFLANLVSMGLKWIFIFFQLCFCLLHWWFLVFLYSFCLLSWLHCLCSTIHSHESHNPQPRKKRGSFSGDSAFISTLLLTICHCCYHQYLIHYHTTQFPIGKFFNIHLPISQIISITHNCETNKVGEFPFTISLVVQVELHSFL